MKYIGFLSLTIGVIGFIAIMYFEYQTHQMLKEMGELEGLINISPYSQLELRLLNISQILGIIFGIVGIIKENTKSVSIASILICSINSLLPYIL